MKRHLAVARAALLLAVALGGCLTYVPPTTGLSVHRGRGLDTKRVVVQDQAGLIVGLHEGKLGLLGVASFPLEPGVYHIIAVNEWGSTSTLSGIEIAEGEWTYFTFTGVGIEFNFKETRGSGDQDEDDGHG